MSQKKKQAQKAVKEGQGGKEAREAIQRLRRQIQRHDHLYYGLDQPEISDREYDRLFQRLKELEGRRPHLITKDSPTQRVPGKPLDHFIKEPLSQKALSLDNTYSIQEIEEFFHRTARLLDGKAPVFLLEPKLDGAAIELIYEKGRLQKALTRGDGRIGENITENIKTVRALPRCLSADSGGRGGGGRRAPLKAAQIPSFLAVRGEAVIFKKDFEELNKERERAALPSLANMRNSAAGALRQLDPSLAARRRIRFFSHGPGALRESRWQRQSAFLSSLKGFGLPVLDMARGKLRFPRLLRLSDSLEGILSYYSEMERALPSLPFEADGIVIKVDSFAAQKKLGATARSPKWAAAGKFEPKTGLSRIKEIKLQIGRTGVVTPVAVIEPLRIGGVTVSRASLHNFKELLKKDIRAGDVVEARRAGDVIPEIVRSLPEKKGRAAAFRPPSRCPACQSVLKEEGEYLCCLAESCPGKQERALIHFASKKCMNIESVGGKTIQKLFQKKWLLRFSDFWKLPERPLEKEEGFGEKSKALLKASLKKSKRPSLARFLFALGIPHIGEEAARKTARALYQKQAAFSSPASSKPSKSPPQTLSLTGAARMLQGLSPDELQEIPDIGGIGAGAIKLFFQNERILEDIQRMEGLGLSFAEQAPRAGQGGGAEAAGAGAGLPLKGQRIALTGKLPMPRGQVKALIERYGGAFAPSVGKGTDILVAGEKPGGKKEKALKAAVPIWTWRQLQKALQQP